MMMVRDILGMSMHNLLLHKVRSVLTSLGVIFGVGSVIAMLAISEGAKRSALAQIEAMGIDKIIVYSKRPPVSGSSEGSGNTGVIERYGLTERDVGHIRQMDNVGGVTTVFDTRKMVLKGITRTSLKLLGCDYSFLEDSHAGIIKGRWFSPLDFAADAPVCVIGKNVRRGLFPLGSTEVVGAKIKIEDAFYRVIGIFDNADGSTYPEIGSRDDMIMIPMTAARVRYKDYTFYREGHQFKITRIAYDLFIVKVNNIEYIDNTAKRISGYLEKAHSDVADWSMVVPLELLRQSERTQNIFTIVMGSIAGISLIVGGIGIMNIMLASVFERRKEIGTRRALGAQKIDILLQFLIETVFLTSLGGVLGIMLGVGIARIITFYSAMPTIFAWWSITLSLAISSFVGVVFGTYPAWQAAQQNPINVLRAE